MAKYTTADIRNVALVGHNDSGKTSLGEAFLNVSKATTRLGSIDDGTTVFDFEPEEKERRVSIDLAIASTSSGGKQLTLLDTPGYSDFCGEAISSFRAAETAVLCIHAASGIMVNTRKMWQRAGENGVARVISVNKLDLPNVDFAALIGRIQEVFGKECVPVMLPKGTGDALSGVVNLLESGAEVPEGLDDLANDAREKLMEIDDDLLEKYLEGTEVSPEEIAKALPGAIQEGRVVPILCTSVEKETGVKESLDFIARYLPSPEQAGCWKAENPADGSEAERKPSPDEPFSGQVFKAVADPFVGRLCYIRVVSGKLTPDASLFNQRTGKGSRMGKLFKPFGKEEQACQEAIAGDIVCVTKVEDLRIGDTVCDQKAPVTFPEVKYPTPMVALAVEPETKKDLARLSESLQKMAESDPTFKFSRDKQTSELVITAMSQLHIDVIVSRLKRKFDVGLVTKTPKIAFMETIQAEAQGHHKHKKQSGGHGQYAEVYMKVRPTERGEGFKFTNSISQGRIPQQFIPAVEKGVKETMERGVMANCTVVDVEAEVYDGSYHDVDSSPAAFQLASSKAFKDAFMRAKAVLLEPVVNIEITIPSKFMGDITGDLNSRRGRIQGMDAEGDQQVIRAQIPYMEITNYETQLRSATGGEGSYMVEPSHYDILPHKMAEGVIAKAQSSADSDED